MTRARARRAPTLLPGGLPSNILEDPFRAQVIELAQWQGWHVQAVRPARTADGWRTPIIGHVGAPDLLLARRGVVALRELKTEKGDFRPGQEEWLEELGEYGGVWRPRDWLRIQAFLRDPVSVLT